MTTTLTEPARASIEKSLLNLYDLLRYAAVVVHESGDGLSGPKRDLAFTGVHLIAEARTELDSLLHQVEAR